MTKTYEYRVIGDSTRTVYSQHSTMESAKRAAKALARKWGWSHPGTEPIVQRITETGWVDQCAYTA